jgi:soluble cytochrome b562
MPKALLSAGTRPVSRRYFIKYSSAAIAATTVAGPFIVRGQNLNGRIRVACIGVGGKGASDTDDAAGCGGELVALCDVDKGTLEKKANKFHGAKLFQDYRKMFDEMGDSIDAVTISTPDHNHAPAAVRALKLGKHVFCQKPLVQTVYEARLVRKLAQEKKLATQMGNHGSAGPGLRRAVEVIQAGIIGPVRELHVWSNRPVWPQGLKRPEGEDSVPDNLNWDAWIGPAQMRPYKKDTYHTFKWRGWKDFGTGALGDMACHTVNMPFRALKMGYPNVVECERSSDLFEETYPKTSRIRFEFPAREDMPPLKFWWYDGNPREKNIEILRPPESATREIVSLRGSLPDSGCLLIGEKGKIFSPDDYGSRFFLLLGDSTEFKSATFKAQEGQKTVEREHESIRDIAQTIPRSPGHMQEWFDMMRHGTAAYSNFDVAAYLTEIILLGCVALQVGVNKRMDWDGPNMKAKNQKDAAQFVKRDYRKGWGV